MPRALWTGSISFGLVNIPVQLFPATQEKSIGFHMLSKDGCRLRRKLFCPETGKEYEYGETVKGYEISAGEYVTFEKDELDKLQPETGRSLEIARFLHLSDVDPVYFDKPYYLGPREDGVKGYALLGRALEQTKMAALARFVMRERSYLTVIRPNDGVMILETLRYADEVRAPKDLEIPDIGKQRLDPRELKLAVQLVQSLVGKFDPEEFHDEYRDKILEVIRQKAEGKEIRPPRAAKAAPSTKVVDLMEVLKASLKEQDRKKGGRTPPRASRAKSGRKSAA